MLERRGSYRSCAAIREGSDYHITATFLPPPPPPPPSTSYPLPPSSHHFSSSSLLHKAYRSLPHNLKPKII